jgi:hypothetical protein
MRKIAIRSQSPVARTAPFEISIRRRRVSAASMILVLVIIATLTIIAACGGGSGSSTTSTGTPAATLSSSSLTFSSGVNVASAAQTVTVSNSGTATLSFSGFSTSSSAFAETNTCGTGVAAGASCTISVTFTPTAGGTVTGTLSIADNASGSPQSVALSGTGNSVSASPSSLNFSPVATSQTVTLSNATSAAVAITSVAVTAGSSNFSQSNKCGTSVAGNGSCAITVAFTPPSSGSVTGTLTIVDGAGTQTVALSGSSTVANTAQVTVNFGPNGYQGPPAASSTSETLSYYNNITTTVTVCAPGSTTNCTTIPNVLVDTGSVGLRVLSSALGSVSLSAINDPSTGEAFYECVQYGDLSYTWGEMVAATVQIGGETASQVPGAAANSGVPIQVIGSGVTPPEYVYSGPSSSYQEIYNPCLTIPSSDDETLSGGVNDDSVAALGTNGILGIGTLAQDCGSLCASLSSTSGQYLICNTTACGLEAIPVADQATNPVTGFPVDNNGVLVTLPSVPAAGQATATGTLTFGIGTSSNNAITTQKVYELDEDGNFASSTYNGVQSTSANSGGTFIDSGSNALIVSDPTTLNTTDCLVSGFDIGLYCPGSPPLTISLQLAGSNNTSGTVTLSIGNALDMFAANTSFAAFNDLGEASCVPSTSSPCDASTDLWDLGLPFFFNRPIFVGIAGATTGTPTQPNGYWAF